MKKHTIEISESRLREFCHRWQITELALFGSVLRSDFSLESDVDFLVTYSPDKHREPWGYYPEQEEMEQLLGRKVDWITRKSVEEARNPLFRSAALESAEVIYAERSENPL